MNNTVAGSEVVYRLCELLGEYAGRLRHLNDLVLEHWATRDANAIWERHAVLLDRLESIRKPLEHVIGSASQMLEHEEPEQFAAEELALRLAEVETELHHSIRLADSLKTSAGRDVKSAQDVARLRMATGLNAMKGGPLRPRS